MFDLTGMTALVTGASGGIGSAICHALAAQGARLAVSGSNVEKLEAFRASLSGDHVAVPCNLGDKDSVEALVPAALEKLGQIDILVNNAGIFEQGSVLDTTLPAFTRTMDINVTGVFLGMKSVAAHMVNRGKGSIVNISSVAGLNGTPGFLAYGASKWAVRGMTKGVAKELAPFGVRVNSIHPGIIDTPMLQTFDEAGEGVREAVRTRIPLGYEAEPIHVARLALYLGSDDSAYSTGSEFVVDGGWSA